MLSLWNASEQICWDVLCPATQVSSGYLQTLKRWSHMLCFFCFNCYLLALNLSSHSIFKISLVRGKKSGALRRQISKVNVPVSVHCVGGMPGMLWKTSRGLFFSWSRTWTPTADYRALCTRGGDRNEHLSAPLGELGRYSGAAGGAQLKYAAVSLLQRCVAPDCGSSVTQEDRAALAVLQQRPLWTSSPFRLGTSGPTAPAVRASLCQFYLACRVFLALPFQCLHTASVSEAPGGLSGRPLRNAVVPTLRSSPPLQLCFGPTP